MYSGSTLSHSDAVSAVELFEQGFLRSRWRFRLTFRGLQFRCCISDGSCEEQVRS